MFGHAWGKRITNTLLALTLATAWALPAPAAASVKRDDDDELRTLAVAELSVGVALAVGSMVLWSGATISIARGHRANARWHTYNYVMAGLHGLFATFDLLATRSDDASIFAGLATTHLLFAAVGVGLGLWCGSLPASDGAPRFVLSPTGMTVRF